MLEDGRSTFGLLDDSCLWCFSGQKAEIAESLMNLISVCSLIGASGFVRRIGHCPGSLVYGVMFHEPWLSKTRVDS